MARRVRRLLSARTEGLTWSDLDLTVDVDRMVTTGQIRFSAPADSRYIVDAIEVTFTGAR
jgi:hypothetical protein